MQLVNTCGSVLASLSFVTNHGKVYINSEVFKSTRFDSSMHNINSDSVFQEAEELISELPRQVPSNQMPFSNIHDAIVPIDRRFVLNKGPNSDDRPVVKAMPERNIRRIIKANLGLSNTEDNYRSDKTKRTQSQSKKKYGPGRPLSMKIWMNIGTNDLITRCKRARKFIEDGIPVMFKIEGQGATSNYMTHAQVIVNTAMSVLSDVAKLGGGLQQHANFLSQIFNPIAKPKDNTSDAKKNLDRPKDDRKTEHESEEHMEGFRSPECNGSTEHQGLNKEKIVDKGADKWIDLTPGSQPIESNGQSLTPFNADESDSEMLISTSSLTEEPDKPLNAYKMQANGEIESMKDATAPDIHRETESVSHETPPKPPVIQPTHQMNTKECSSSSKSDSKGYWMDVNESVKAKQNSVSSKYMTIDKPGQIQQTEKAPSTVKNDAMLQRFLAMRSGERGSSHENFATEHMAPASQNVIPTPPMVPTIPIVPQGSYPYEAVPATLMKPFEDQPSYGQKFPWQHRSSTFRAAPSTPYKYGRKWYASGDINHVPVPKAPAFPPPTLGPTKPASASKSRWMTLDKNQD
ncbi:Translation initiation factor IF-3 domain- containing protein [Babesia divergens]|uniref:Translation initiation factor IF-3 domain-containing protein n=1 Tax=Babesia divergens TaxID=32595 RepID=A0AAD9LJ45_BABDI|nr:Translation initiation factor IF-3 domain- containing protein [Babesia divergens]